MNTQQPSVVAPELPKGYRLVETIEPEALEASAAMLADPKQQATAHMRKNMWALRARVRMSLAPIVRVEDTEGRLSSYAWNIGAKILDDVKLERKLKSQSCRQLLKMQARGSRRAEWLSAKADKCVVPARATALRERAGHLRNLASAADYELRFERWGEQVFKNSDGN